MRNSPASDRNVARDTTGSPPLLRLHSELQVLIPRISLTWTVSERWKRYWDRNRGSVRGRRPRIAETPQHKMTFLFHIEPDYCWQQLRPGESASHPRSFQSIIQAQVGTATLPSCPSFNILLLTPLSSPLLRTLKADVFTLVLMRAANPKESKETSVPIYESVIHWLLLDENEGIWSWLGTASHWQPALELSLLLFTGRLMALVKCIQINSLALGASGPIPNWI